MAEKEEGKRDRVRRILIDPLKADGMRFRKTVTEEKQRQSLDRLADDLSYMTDDGLHALRLWMRSHGDGAAKCFWPMTVSIISTAESFEPRPLEELPALRRWFASAAGRRALEGDRLVAEYEFWRKFKRPPITPRDQEAVARRAAEWASKAERVQDRIRRGLLPMHDDASWLHWYEETTERAKALVSSAIEGAA
ncbi:hypothetical protein [uncultured Roseobacter sp.]|uniref:hypothetical protein n=1 Tax=uncultured Roseobacter sp. TaxID=114847 RepID=UPI002611C2DB|nr:hypothetical protein [uncultured Roseobacter sp.]